MDKTNITLNEKMENYIIENIELITKIKTLENTEEVCQYKSCCSQLEEVTKDIQELEQLIIDSCNHHLYVTIASNQSTNISAYQCILCSKISEEKYKTNSMDNLFNKMTIPSIQKKYYEILKVVDDEESIAVNAMISINEKEGK